MSKKLKIKIPKPNIILYFDDEPCYRICAKEDLEKEFVNYKIITAYCGNETTMKEIIEEAQGIENIAIVCTDGHLIGGCDGWEVIEWLRQKKYTGHAIHTGYSELPPDKRNLFVGNAQKTGKDLISKIKEHIVT